MTSNTSEAVELLRNRKEQLTIELKKSEKMIYDLETAYLNAEYSHMGSVLKGLEGFLSAKEAMKRRVRTNKLEDRLFSLSSRSSQATKELEQQEAELAESLTASHLGRGKGPYASKGIAVKGRR